MTGSFAGRDAHEVDALVTDRYLEGLLAAHERGADRAPLSTGSEPAADLRRTADRLSVELPRFHPSFRFEEALAGRLAEVAARMRLPAAAGGEELIVPFRPRGVIHDADVLLGDPDVVGTGADRAAGADLRTAIGRPLLIGGALTSAAISIAGAAAYVAWRLNRPPASAMARAARAVARTRPV